MKTFRLIGIGLIAVLISFANSSCGGDDEEDDMPDSPPKEDITPSEPTPEEPKDPENGEESGTGEIQGHKYVDLGLSVKWADRNIGANSPEHYGSYFAWGETEPKSNYSMSNYKWSKGKEYDFTKFTKYCINSKYGYNGFTDDKTILDKEDDAAYVNWGDKWRMPTHLELEELIYNCKWEWTTSNNVDGYLVTGVNGNTIFLPAAGIRSGSNLHNAGTGGYGYYWSSTLNEKITFSGEFTGGPYGSELFFKMSEYTLEGIYGGYELSQHDRSGGLTIRPVVSEN